MERESVTSRERKMGFKFKKEIGEERETLSLLFFFFSFFSFSLSLFSFFFLFFPSSSYIGVRQGIFSPSIHENRDLMVPISSMDRGLLISW